MRCLVLGAATGFPGCSARPAQGDLARNFALLYVDIFLRNRTLFGGAALDVSMARL